MLDRLLKKTGSWTDTGPSSDVVITTRVRLARNMPSISFPHRQDSREFTLLEAVTQRFVNESRFQGRVYLVELSGVNEGDKRFLRERNIITTELEGAQNSLAVIENDEEFVIMVNEEDHFRIQVIRPGLRIMECCELADRIDDELNIFASYAFSDEHGYLAACPSNTGTGLKVSLMLHLPMITMSKKLAGIISVMKEKMVLLKGITGGGAETVGSIYLVSNSAALGLSEVDIAELMDGTARLLVDAENDARDEFLGRNRTRLEDRIWRSLGILKYGRSINYIEAVEHLSNIRLGVILSVIKNIDLHRINDLMVNIQWSHLQRIAGEYFQNLSDCDAYRADYLRSQLA
jgi:protein arginine kinase